MSRYGMTIPLDGIPLSEHRSWFEALSELGYSDLWSSEANATDAFTPLALAAAWAPGMRLGSAIVPAFTRGPGLMAMSVAAMAEAAPDRFLFGIGTSSNVIVESWNATSFDRPYQQTRDMVRFLKQALTGERVDASFDTFAVKGFRLGRPPPSIPPILIAALRPGMLQLAGREGDGAIINWLSAEDVAKVIPYVGPGKEIVARIFVCPSDDEERVRAMGRFAVSAYLNVPVYAAFHEWLGRGPVLKPMWDAWKAGDRRAATAAIPDQVVDDLIVHGTPEECRAHIDRYLANGVTTAAVALVGAGIDTAKAIRDLAPRG